MKMNELSLVSKVNLICYKQSCEKIRLNIISNTRKEDNWDILRILNPNIASTLIEWEHSKISRMRKDDVNEFIKDTDTLISNTGLKVIFELWAKSSIEYKEDFSLFFSYIFDYLEKWGSFIHYKQRNVEAIEFITSCYNVFLSLHLWTDKNHIKYLEYILNPVNHSEVINKMLFVNIRSEEIKYWTPTPCKDYQWIPINDIQSKKVKQSYKLKIRQPNIETYNKLQKSGIIEYIKNEILNSISGFIAEQKIKITPKIKNGDFSFNLELNNGLLIYLFYKLPGIMNKSIRYCQCGCGQILPDNKSKWFKGHYEKKRNDNADRVINNRLRKRKNDGNLTEKRYIELSKEVKTYFMKGYSEEDIWIKISELL